MRNTPIAPSISPPPSSAQPNAKASAKIFTGDRRDFSIYRLHNCTRPTLFPLFSYLPAHADNDLFFFSLCLPRLQCHNPPAMERTFHVYFMASKSGVLYLGVTGAIERRAFQHKEKLIPGFTQKYNCTKLVWFEPHSTARAAISREKQIKRWNRAKKSP
jgi:putative endonuclease